MKALNISTGQTVADTLLVADSLLSRLKGLLGRNALDQGEGLWIIPCTGVHTFGMKFPIDVVFLDHNHSVISVIEALPPNRISRQHVGAASVLELPGNLVRMVPIRRGDRIRITA